MPRLTDIWRTGIVRAPFEQIALHGLGDQSIEWLAAGPPFTFLADPFGLWREGTLHLFVEAFDYRDRHGRIDVLRFDADLRQIDRTTCLREPWHLSYPFVFEADGETWMLPEAHRSGGLHLYRAIEFPTRWQRVATIALDGVAVDASPVFHDGLWWLFYTVATDRWSKIGALHIAFADRLTGPWRCHPRNPVRLDMSSARPGGTPRVINGCVVAPMQDCTRTYGGQAKLLWIDELSPTTFASAVGHSVSPRPDFGPFRDGLHTLSACGEVTLIDAKRIDRSARRLAIDAARIARRLFRSV